MRYFWKWFHLYVWCKIWESFLPSGLCIPLEKRRMFVRSWTWLAVMIVMSRVVLSTLLIYKQLNFPPCFSTFVAALMKTSRTFDLSHTKKLSIISSILPLFSQWVLWRKYSASSKLLLDFYLEHGPRTPSKRQCFEPDHIPRPKFIWPALMVSATQFCISIIHGIDASSDLPCIMRLINKRFAENRPANLTCPTLENVLQTVTFADDIRGDNTQYSRHQTTLIFLVTPMIFQQQPSGGSLRLHPNFVPRPVGIAVVTICESIWRKLVVANERDIFVQQEWRGCGYTHMLGVYVKEVIRRINTGRFDEVLDSLVSADFAPRNSSNNPRASLRSPQALMEFGEQLKRRAQRNAQ